MLVLLYVPGNDVGEDGLYLPAIHARYYQVQQVNVT